MIPVKAGSTTYTLSKLFDMPVLFTNLRIDRESLPEGLYAYDVRDYDGTGDAVHLQPFVLVDHWGTVITAEEIAFPDARYPQLCIENELIYSCDFGTGICTSISLDGYRKFIGNVMPASR